MQTPQSLPGHGDAIVTDLHLLVAIDGGAVSNHTAERLYIEVIHFRSGSRLPGRLDVLE